MGLILGILAVLLVFILIFAMALAEWSDKDLGEFFLSLGRKQKETQELPAPKRAAASESSDDKDGAPKLKAKRPARKTGASQGKTAAKAKKTATKPAKAPAAKTKAVKKSTVVKKTKTKKK